MNKDRDATIKKMKEVVYRKQDDEGHNIYMLGDGHFDMIFDLVLSTQPTKEQIKKCVESEFNLDNLSESERMILHVAIKAVEEL